MTPRARSRPSTPASRRSPRPKTASSARCWPAPRPRSTRPSSRWSACLTSSSPSASSCRRASSPRSCTPSRPSGRRSWSTCSAWTSTAASARRANGLATAADAQLAAIDQHLAGMTDADDAALEAATARVEVVRALGGGGRPGGAEARRRPARPRRTPPTRWPRSTRRSGGWPRSTRRPTPPRWPRRPPRRTPRSTTPPRRSPAPRRREEKLRGELAAAGDATALRRLLDAHAERERLAGDAETIVTTLAQAEKEHARRRVGADQGAHRGQAGPAGPRGRARGLPGGGGDGPGRRAAPAPAGRRRLPGLHADGHRAAGRVASHCAQLDGRRRREGRQGRQEAGRGGRGGRRRARPGGPRTGPQPGRRPGPRRADPGPAGRARRAA